MRIAVVLDPPARAERADELLKDLLQSPSASVVTLPTIDPLSRALVRELGQRESGDAAFVVLARVGVGALDARRWQELGLAERAERLLPIEDPAVEEAIEEGAAHLARRDIERAHRCYALADSLLAWEHGPRRAEVLVQLAGIELARGDSPAAIALLDRALAIHPDHQVALRQRVELARGAADDATAAALRRRLLRFATDDTERAEILSAIADDSLLATTEALEQALLLRPKDPRLLERLQASLEAAGRWREAVDAKVALSETIESQRDRARALTAAAGMCARRTNDVPRAVALYEAAIADDPSAPGAFEAIEAVLVKNADWTSVESAYARQLERLAERGEKAGATELLDKLAKLRAELLDNVHGAIMALDQWVQIDPENVTARSRLAQLLEKGGELELAARCLETAAIWGPTRPETFRQLHRICARLGDMDRAYCACAVLVHLGEADLDEQAVYRHFAPETTPRPTAALDLAGWGDLFAPEHDEVVSRIVRAIAPAAIELRVEQLRAAGRLPELSKKERQNPEKTTVTAARTAAWACAVLGLPVPEIYARTDDFPGGLAYAAVGDPTLLLGKSLLTGRSVPELAFAIGRELACQHLTARLVTFYPTLPELRSVIIAAVAQVVPSSLPSDAVTLRDALKAKLDAAGRRELESAVEALQARDGRLELKGWIREIEMTSCRAGLLVCGDVTAAARMLAVDGRVIGGLTAADRIRDLVPFSVSERYSRLRRALGVGATPSIPPPPGA
jgi:tetratricopeptide (TPR) repeat protein